MIAWLAYDRSHQDRDCGGDAPTPPPRTSLTTSPQMEEPVRNKHHTTQLNRSHRAAPGVLRRVLVALGLLTLMASVSLVSSGTALGVGQEGSLGAVDTLVEPAPAARHVDIIEAETCESAQVSSRSPAEMCRAVVTTYFGPETVVSSEELEALAEAGVLEPELFVTYYSRTWTQEVCAGGGCGIWSEAHKGKIYRDGTYVWMNKRYTNDIEGYHDCGFSHGSGFSVENLSCTETGVNPTTYRHRAYDKFKVSWFFNGFPVSDTYYMYLCVYPEINSSPETCGTS